MSLQILQRRMSTFVEWIATDSTKEDEIRDQAKSIRKKICAKAEDDGLTVQSTPNSGSFAKRTGLRRHLRGGSMVDGQDVDLPFVVEPKTEDDEKLTSLLPRFERYAKAAYPKTKLERTKSSICLKFSNELSYDLVPMLATSDSERQILIRSTGERRETSVQKHIEFIKKRTRKSNDENGRVKFNEVIRLKKWWRYHRQDASHVLDKVPTFVIDLLSAYAFDHRGVQKGYAQTFAEWSGFLARTVRRREIVAFRDYTTPPSTIPADEVWAVIDPVSPDNNVVESWTSIQVDELADWLVEAHDTLCDAIVSHEGGHLAQGLDELVAVFGTAFRAHCGD